jgi:hypothetical protein
MLIIIRPINYHFVLTLGGGLLLGRKKEKKKTLLLYQFINHKNVITITGKGVNV